MTDQVERSWRFGAIGTESVPGYQPDNKEKQAEHLRDYIVRTEAQLKYFREILKGLEDEIAMEKMAK